MSLAYTIGAGAEVGAGVGTRGVGVGMNRDDDGCVNEVPGAEAKPVPIVCAMFVDVDVA